ncbi:hypothetical protein COCON_G00013260 [Conger conger]|uniref:Uncharacterized protein n=1 Tax=Conger conger TaxID=82655 RepID=A0A9Q1E2W3_CONCO|nr:hypothetical protein COCON_G00013260 [Conger conger]
MRTAASCQFESSWELGSSHYPSYSPLSSCFRLSISSNFMLKQRGTLWLNSVRPCGSNCFEGSEKSSKGGVHWSSPRSPKASNQEQMYAVSPFQSSLEPSPDTPAHPVELWEVGRNASPGTDT